MTGILHHTVHANGIRQHFLEAGIGAPVVLLHGFPETSFAWRFQIPELAKHYRVIAPDLRGYGKSAWQPQGYWYADYIADLEALLQAFAPGESVDLAGHSLGGNVVLHYAGIRPARVRRVISLDAFGVRAEEPSAAPEKYAKWLDALSDPKDFADYASFDAVADRLRKNSRRLTKDQADFLAQHWAEALPDGRIRLSSDPRHKLPFPTIYRIEETYAVWRNITAPTLWVAAADSNIPKWLNDHPEGEGATDTFAAVKRRFAHIPNGRMVTIPDAGHMLHHDQPAAVAAAIEAFLDE